MTTESSAADRWQLQAQIDELWDFDDPAASEGRFRTAAASAATFERGVMLTQVARSLGLQQRYADALRILDSVEGTAEPDVDVRARLERGRIFNSGNDATAARPEFEAAFALATGHGLETLAVDALHMIAIVAPTEEQAELHARAIAMAEGASDPRARQWLASLYNNAGWTSFDAGDLNEALRLFELALEERLRLGTPRQIGIARWSVGRALRALGRTDAALAIQEDLQRANADAGVDDPYVSEELGECLLTLGRPAEARPNFSRAVAQLSADAWLAEHEPERIERLRDLAAG